jgi:hypothetical protein
LSQTIEEKLIEIGNKNELKKEFRRMESVPPPQFRLTRKIGERIVETVLLEFLDRGRQAYPEEESRVAERIFDFTKEETKKIKENDRMNYKTEKRRDNFIRNSNFIDGQEWFKRPGENSIPITSSKTQYMSIEKPIFKRESFDKSHKMLISPKKNLQIQNQTLKITPRRNSITDSAPKQLNSSVQSESLLLPKWNKKIKLGMYSTAKAKNKAALKTLKHIFKNRHLSAMSPSDDIWKLELKKPKLSPIEPIYEPSKAPLPLANLHFVDLPGSSRDHLSSPERLLYKTISSYPQPVEKFLPITYSEELFSQLDNMVCNDFLRSGKKMTRRIEIGKHIDFGWDVIFFEEDLYQRIDFSVKYGHPDKPSESLKSMSRW